MNNNKIALVTGASRGIGADIAKKLASAGYHTIINYNKSEEKAVEVLTEIRNDGFSCELYKCDVSKSNEVNEMFKYIKMCYGKIDVLVNNAGISITKAFQDLQDEEWDEIVATNLSSVFYCSREAIKLMIARETFGKIINISSMWGLVGGSMESHYSATKAGIIGLSKALAKEVAPQNITVNVIAPGAIYTDMMKELGEDTLNYLESEIPLGKIGKVDDISNMVIYLASDKADYITGQVFSINGGMVI
ncbi:MAG: 3-oxoacyl-ACP reductase FabG [Clostridia bacterium]|nr:3-oxoacyl-ACP reductase FabG [Clostridia bacterium]